MPNRLSDTARTEREAGSSCGQKIRPLEDEPMIGREIQARAWSTQKVRDVLFGLRIRRDRLRREKSPDANRLQTLVEIHERILHERGDD